MGVREWEMSSVTWGFYYECGRMVAPFPEMWNTVCQHIGIYKLYLSLALHIYIRKKEQKLIS